MTENRFKTSFGINIGINRSPRDWLAYRTVIQCLEAAYQQVDNSTLISLDEIVEKYEIESLLELNTSQISAGEAALVAMAKCEILAPDVRRVCISSPLSCLSSHSASKFMRLHRILVDRIQDVTYLLLAGELDETPLSCLDLSESEDFELQMRGVSTKLGSLDTDDDELTTVRFDDFHETLSSPCLVVGENGAGKTLLGEVLSKAVSSTGIACVNAYGESDRARMVFQDSLRQAMCRNGKRFQDTNPLFWKKIEETYNLIIDGACSAAKKMGLSVPRVQSIFEVHPTLFQSKAMLCAARLQGRPKPGALILDEPSSGLSRDECVALVTSVADICSRRNVPLIIISHRSWWEKIVRDRIRVTKTIDGRKSFSVQLKKIGKR